MRCGVEAATSSPLSGSAVEPRAAIKLPNSTPSPRRPLDALACGPVRARTRQTNMHRYGRGGTRRSSGREIT
eukprot:scaffold264764_cov24-Tisochrysis_lutea.AAC.2